jgi:AcrR family transcriptional regulator
MPPKAKFSSERIIEAAFSVVRREGWSALSARSIAKELGASTGPIYAYLPSMTDIEEAVVGKALDLYQEYLTAPQTGDPWLDSGIGYIQFAFEEHQLFRCINDEKHTPMQRKLGRKLWERLSVDLKGYPQFEGMDDDIVVRIRMARWMLVHGLASLLNMGWFRMDTKNRLIINDGKHVSIEMLIRYLSNSLCKGMKEGGELPDPGR